MIWDLAVAALMLVIAAALVTSIAAGVYIVNHAPDALDDDTMPEWERDLIAAPARPGMFNRCHRPDCRVCNPALPIDPLLASHVTYLTRQAHR